MKKLRKGTRVELLGQQAIGTVVCNFKDQCVDWVVVRGEDGKLVVDSIYNFKKIPSHIRTLLELIIYKDQARVISAVGQALMRNSPYMGVLKGGKFPQVVTR